MKRSFTFAFALVCTLLMSTAIALQPRVFTKKDVATAFFGKGDGKNVVQSKPKLKAATEGEAVSRAYGVRIYYDGKDVERTESEIVSFDVDNPADITVEHVLEGKDVRAAAYVDGTYYMVESDDGFVAYRLSSFNMDTKEYKVVAEYGRSDRESALMVQSMTYNQVDKKIYLYAFDIINSEGEGEELDIPFELFTLDPATGKVTLIGEETSHQILTLVADSEGTLYGLDTFGTLYTINKQKGYVIEDFEAGYTTDIPQSLQSMAFDSESNEIYWAGFSVTTTGEGESATQTGRGFFSKFRYSEDEGWIYNPISDLAGNSELVGLYIDSNPLPKDAPAAVTDLKLVAGEKGALEANLSWMNPKTDIGGNALSGTLTVNIYRDGKVVKTVDGQKPGEPGSAVVAEVASGVFGYTVAAQSDKGEGKTAYVEGFVGRDTPGAVGDLKIEKAAGKEELTVSWTKPAEGEHGGWFDESSLKYKVMRLPDNVVVEPATAATTYTDENITDMAGYSYKITPVNAEGDGIAAESPMEFAGKPLSVPFACDFTTDALVRLWKVFDNDADGDSWSLFTNKSGSFMKYFPVSGDLSPDKAADDWLISAPISLEKDKVYALKYVVYTQGELFPADFSVTLGNGSDIASQTKVLKKIDDFTGMDLKEQTITFSVDKPGNYNIGIQARNRVQILVTNVKVEESSAVDLAALSIQGVTSPVVGKSSTYSVQVRNNGSSTAKDYKLQLVDDSDNVLATTDAVAEIAAYSTGTMSIDWTPETAGKVNVRAKVVASGDANPDNDYSGSIAVTVLSDGEWFDVAKDGMMMSGFAPFYFRDNYSTSQTIYGSDIVKSGKGTIKGMMLYYNATKDVDDIPVKIYLANTKLADFNDDAAPVAADQFTKVFDGKVSVPKGQTSTTILFDTPFAYDGGNLCMMGEQSVGKQVTGIFFMSQQIKDDANKYMWVYYGAEHFDFSQPATKYLNDRASVSFFVSGAEGGIEGNVADAEISVYPNPTADMLHISSNCDRVRVFNVGGQLVEEVADGGNSVSLAKLPAGIYFVELTSNGTKTVKRVIKK